MGCLLPRELQWGWGWGLGDMGGAWGGDGVQPLVGSGGSWGLKGWTHVLTILPPEEQEKLNVWVALLNLENCMAPRVADQGL